MELQNATVCALGDGASRPDAVWSHPVDRSNDSNATVMA
jgi:hypothetical protein